jgi:hypothetical protein
LTWPPIEVNSTLKTSGGRTRAPVTVFAGRLLDARRAGFGGATTRMSAGPGRGRAGFAEAAHASRSGLHPRETYPPRQAVFQTPYAALSCEVQCGQRVAARGTLILQKPQSFVLAGGGGFGINRLTDLMSRKTANATIRNSITVLMKVP